MMSYYTFNRFNITVTDHINRRCFYTQTTYKSNNTLIFDFFFSTWLMSNHVKSCTKLHAPLRFKTFMFLCFLVLGASDLKPSPAK